MSNIELCTTFLSTHSFNSSKYKLLRREKSKQGSCANFAYNTRYPRSSPFNSTSRVRGYFHTSTDLSVVHKRLRRIFPYTSIIRKNLKCTGNTTGKKRLQMHSKQWKNTGVARFRNRNKVQHSSLVHLSQQTTKKLPFDQLQTKLDTQIPPKIEVALVSKAFPCCPSGRTTNYMERHRTAKIRQVEKQGARKGRNPREKINKTIQEPLEELYHRHKYNRGCLCPG